MIGSGESGIPARVGAGTAVTWARRATKRLLGQPLRLILNLDAMVGDKFEEGLARMKAVAEASARK